MDQESSELFGASAEEQQVLLEPCSTVLKNQVCRKTAPILSGAGASCLSHRIIAILCLTQHVFDVCCAHFSQ